MDAEMNGRGAVGEPIGQCRGGKQQYARVRVILAVGSRCIHMYAGTYLLPSIMNDRQSIVILSMIGDLSSTSTKIEEIAQSI